ncbi:MAG: IS1595 family transposase [Planctomycetes bacterium]|nr:IS1595 family transposase [Planctomycetota bacterium]
MNERRKRGLEIVQAHRIVQRPDGKWIVPSQSGNGFYAVDLEAQTCECRDHLDNGAKCKHLHAAEIARKLLQNDEIRRRGEIPVQPKPVSLIELAESYDTRDKCLDLLESLRWPHGPICPRCECPKVYSIKARRVHECSACKYHFSVTSGTILHDSRMPLTKWILGVALIANARKGVSACQLSRDLHLTYKSAWYLGHRIRRAMRETAWLEKFTGVVELDETYVGGKARGGKRGRGAANKEIVFGARERGGKVRITSIPDITGKTIAKAVHKYVDTDAEMVMADELSSYNQLAAEFTMERIQHSREYVRGQVHTNGIESIWAVLKRQVHGTHHKMSSQYLPLYLSEISYRFNHRQDHELFLRVLRNGLITDRQVADGGAAAEQANGEEATPDESAGAGEP